MPEIELVFFGPPLIKRDGQIVKLRSKAFPLLALLAVKQGSLSREMLADRLWYGESGRDALRTTIKDLRQALHPSVIVRYPEDPDYAVRLNLSGKVQSDETPLQLTVDIDLFRRKITAYEKHCRHTQALCADCQEALSLACALYKGDFMADFVLKDFKSKDIKDAFEVERAEWWQDWLTGCQLEFRGSALDAFYALGAHHVQAGALPQALEYLEQCVKLDRDYTSISMLQLLMQVYAQMKQQEKAARVYQHYEKTLRQLGLEPDPSLTELYQQIRHNAPPPDLHATPPPPALTPQYSMATTELFTATEMFALPVAMLEVLGAHVSDDGRREIALLRLDAELTLGRDKNRATVTFSEPSLSRLHARVTHQPGVFMLYNLSDQGTHVAKLRTETPTSPLLKVPPEGYALHDGDVIYLGKLRLRFHIVFALPT